MLTIKLGRGWTPFTGWSCADRGARGPFRLPRSGFRVREDAAPVARRRRFFHPTSDLPPIG